MKFSYVFAVMGLGILSACATQSSVPAGMKVGQFVSYQCDGGKRLQARLSADGSSVRVRFEGGYELDRKADGVFEGEGFKLTSANGMLALMHNGKAAAGNCKPA